MQNNIIEHAYKICTLWENQSHLGQSEFFFIPWDVRNKNGNLNCFFSMQGRHINNCNELGLNAILNYSIYKKINTIYICTHTHIDTNEIHFFCPNCISCHIFDYKSQEIPVPQHYYK